MPARSSTEQFCPRPSQSAKRNAIAAEAALKQRARAAKELSVEGIEAGGHVGALASGQGIAGVELHRLQSEFDDRCVHP